MVTQLLSCHGHHYDEVLLLIPIAWMAECNTFLLRAAPAILLGTAFVLSWRTPRNYLMAIPLCAYVVAAKIRMYKRTERLNTTFSV